MSRTLYDIAYASLNDLYEIQEAFNQMNTLFTVLAARYPADSSVYAVAEFGLSVNEDWAVKVAQWTECMDNELDGFPEEAKAYRYKHLRREALRAGGSV